MMRSLLTVIFLVLFASNLQAAGSADLKAAQAAVEKGGGDAEPIDAGYRRHRHYQGKERLPNR